MCHGKQETILELPRSPSEPLRVALSSYNGHDLRLWFKDPHSGILRPNTKGLTILPRMLADVSKVLEES